MLLKEVLEFILLASKFSPAMRHRLTSTFSCEELLEEVALSSQAI